MMQWLCAHWRDVAAIGGVVCMFVLFIGWAKVIEDVFYRRPATHGRLTSRFAITVSAITSTRSITNASTFARCVTGLPRSI